MKTLFAVRVVLVFCVSLTSIGSLCYPQTTTFLPDDEIRTLSNEISGDRAFEHIRWLSHWHRDSGMEGYFKAAEYVVGAAKDAGLVDVRFIEQPLPGPKYTARGRAVNGRTGRSETRRHR